jgi:8-oxo-dGTP pyrophosphatase MutT (NUDIX family)
VSASIYVLLSADRRYALMEKRPPDDVFSGGEWVFPGGVIEEGEEPWEAMLRELKEETGVVGSVWAPLSDDFIQIYHRKVEDHFRVYPFVVTEWTGRVPISVLDAPDHELDWVNPGEAMRSAVRPTALIAMLLHLWAQRHP